MDVDALREQNEAKTEEETKRGPAREDPEAAPIADAIRAYHERGDLSFGIPAPRSGDSDVVGDAAGCTGPQAFAPDVGMNNGVDTRQQSWQVEPTAMKLFAEAV